MYAIIEDSGTQIKVSEGDVIDVDLRERDDDSPIMFERVLAIGDTSNEDPARVGMPYLEGASVTAEVIEEIKEDKIHVIKFKRRKGYKRKQGHRQPYLRIRVGEITG